MKSLGEIIMTMVFTIILGFIIAAVVKLIIVSIFGPLPLPILIY